MCDLDRKGSKWDRIIALEDKVDQQDKELDDLKKQVSAISVPKPKKKK